MVLSQSAPVHSKPSPPPNLVVKLDLQDQLRVLFLSPFTSPLSPKANPPVSGLLCQVRPEQRGTITGEGLVGQTIATLPGTEGLANMLQQM